MLKRFEVRNYKGFKYNMIWDLSETKNYANSKKMVKNKISKNSIIYGKNGSGKTSLCSAIMDITYHLLDVQKDLTPSFLFTYIGNDDISIDFKYTFLFGKKEVTYLYTELNSRELLKEQLFVDGKEVIRHDFIDERENFIDLKGAKSLKTNGLQRQLSVIKFIYNNTIVDESSVICQLYKFVKGMLYFRSLRETNQYIGYKLGGESLDSIILKNDKLNEFQSFLTNMDLNYDLVSLTLGSGNVVIGARFENGKIIPFNDIASSGTRVIMLFYCWLLEFSYLSFVIIDEFDVYYHHEVAKKVLEIINNFDNLQSMVTTHNVTLLNKETTRPDCAYIIDKSGVINISNRSKKELRLGNNIEKMYRNKEFSLDDYKGDN